MQTQSRQPPAGGSRVVQLDAFGGPEVLDVREVPAPQAGPGQVRVRVTAAGLNPMDWIITADADTAARFGLALPAGFGTDYAGVVDQVGDGATGFAPGDRVFGGALSRAVADFVLIDPAGETAANEAHHTPDGVDDRTAATLTIAGRTASAALAAVGPGPEDTVLIGGAAGGVGVFAVQLARLAGARVIGRDESLYVAESRTDRLVTLYATDTTGLLDGTGVMVDHRFPTIELLEIREREVYFDPTETNGFPWCSQLQIYLELSKGGKREQDIASAMREHIITTRISYDRSP